MDLYDREDVDWDGQYSSDRKRRTGYEDVTIDMEILTRKLRKPRFETHEEINQRMLSVERAVKEALLGKGERHFTDQDFPPNDRSLYVDPGNRPPKLQASIPLLIYLLEHPAQPKLLQLCSFSMLFVLSLLFIISGCFSMDETY